MSPWFWELQVCVRGNHKGSAWGGTGGEGGCRRKAHKYRVRAGDETRRERGRVSRKLRDRVPVSSWVWVSFVFGVMLQRHVASLEWELTWFSVTFVPYSFFANFVSARTIKRQLKGIIILFYFDVNKFVSGVNSSNQWYESSESDCELYFFWCEQSSFSVITWEWCETHLTVWIIEKAVKHTFLVWNTFYFL